MHFSVPRLVDHSMVLSRQPRHPSRKACPTKAVCVPRPGLVIMLREVFVSKGSTSFLKSLCGKRLQRCLVDEVLPLKG